METYKAKKTLIITHDCELLAPFKYQLMLFCNLNVSQQNNKLDSEKSKCTINSGYYLSCIKVEVTSLFFLKKLKFISELLFPVIKKEMLTINRLLGGYYVSL